MSMYNLIEYNSNYSETTGSLWIYSEDESTDPMSESIKVIRKKRSSDQSK